MRTIRTLGLVTVAATIVALSPISASATAIINFANNDTFEGDAAGGTAGPFTDPATAVAISHWKNVCPTS